MKPVDQMAQLPVRSPLPAVADGPFDQMAALTRRVLKVPVVLVSLVDQQQQSMPGAVGLADALMAARTMPLSYSFCQYVVAGGTPLIVPDVREHPLLAGNPTIEENQVIAYAGVPLTDADDMVVGSLCAIDTEPHTWTEEEVATLSDLAAACSAELRLRSITAKAAVAEDRERIAGRLAENVTGELLSVTMTLGSLCSRTTGRDAEQLAAAMDAIDGVLANIRSALYQGQLLP